MKKIYLDYAAATPVDPEVIDTMAQYWFDKYQNPSANYLSGREARSELDKYRNKVALTLGIRPAEVVFTAGATEANNLAIQGLLRQYPGAEILVSAIEHESVLAPTTLFNCRQLPVDGTGRILLNKLSNMIGDNTVMVSVMLVNNELGTIQPIREIAALLDEIKKQRRAAKKRLPLYLHTDAAQAGNYLDLHASRIGADMMSLNGGKIYGPKQSGALFVKAGTVLQPLILGGGQEFGLRSGTENLAAAAGFATALAKAQQSHREESQRVEALRDLFIRLTTKKIPTAAINTSKKHNAPHLISVTIPGFDNERLMMELDEAGIECAVGSACSASRSEASHVLSAIGLSDEQARATLRFSLGRDTTEDEVLHTVNELARLTAYNR